MIQWLYNYISKEDTNSKNININEAVQKIYKNTFAERHMTKGQTL